jgi:tryptophan-rich sensory protein
VSAESALNQTWLVLAGFLAICFAVAATGSVFTFKSVNTWYTTLRKPSFNPPNWIFGPVWSTLYFMMALSAWLVWRYAGWNDAKGALLLFFTQLALNLAWSGLFFGLRRPGMALLEIVFLLAAILATAAAFYPFSRTAFYLMMPYAAWVSFASILNFKIWQLNSGVA